MLHEHVVAGLVAALRAGALTADALALQARKFAETDDHPHTVDTPALPAGTVVSEDGNLRSLVHCGTRASAAAVSA